MEVKDKIPIEITKVVIPKNFDHYDDQKKLFLNLLNMTQKRMN